MYRNPSKFNCKINLYELLLLQLCRNLQCKVHRTNNTASNDHLHNWANQYQLNIAQIHEKLVQFPPVEVRLSV